MQTKLTRQLNAIMKDTENVYNDLDKIQDKLCTIIHTNETQEFEDIERLENAVILNQKLIDIILNLKELLEKGE